MARSACASGARSLWGGIEARAYSDPMRLMNGPRSGNRSTWSCGGQSPHPKWSAVEGVLAESPIRPIMDLDRTCNILH